MEKVVRVIRLAAPISGVALLALAVPKLVGPEALFRGFRVPIVALELVENEEEVKKVVAELGHEQVHSRLRFDYVFIVIYALLLLTLSFWLFRQEISRARLLGFLLSICSVGTAFVDVVENTRTFTMLDRTNEATIDAVRRAALAKWTLFFAVMGTLAAVFLPRRGWPFVAGNLCMVVTVVGALGLVRHRFLIEWAFAFAGLALLPIGEAVRSIAERT